MSPGRSSDRQSDDLSLPPRIGSYTIRGQLGRGGMGVVYLAEDPILTRNVDLPDHLATDRNAYERFEHEAQTLAALNHPSIATIHSLEGTAVATF